ncbi:Cytochrome P450 family protein [Frankia canadensis]|uniref:Cytochrome P450 family protein n=1 Tax=Frankia canadensis TaxID=1836972 RepID=A0A2I2L2V4_9ACTN|nr:cytochrome P450 [Frankia canadensis]SNQ52260.1 Cytochrome P450 family protein [Frankia canadensis]SOU59550.1 Cytochrome P450 family protein [Frankia canadensis]
MDTSASAPTIAFDHHDPVFARDPYEFYASVRERPVFWSPLHGGFWLVTGYDEVRQVAIDDATFLSGHVEPGVGGVSIPTLSPVPSVPIEVDNPDAERLRKVLLADLAPRAVERRAPAIREMVTRAIDGFVESGRCDLMNDLAKPVPAQMIMHWLGLDDTRWAEFVDTVHQMLHSAGDLERVLPAVTRISEWITEAMAERRTDGFRDDLISKLMQSLSDDEAASYTFTLIVAGLDTTSAAIGNALVQIDRRPELRARLLAEPAVLPFAVEEFLRYDAPLQLLARTAARDVEVGGVRIAKGDRLLVGWAAANRDPDVFPDPSAIDADRGSNRHLAFGVGLHRCLGSNVARSTMRIVLEELLRRLPDFQLVGEVERYPDAALIYSPLALPATFTAGSPSAPATPVAAG